MTLPIIALLVIFAVGLVLFTGDFFPAEVTALGMLLAMILLDLIPLETAFSGFGSETVMMIFGLLILIAALERNGIAGIVGRLLSLEGQPGPRRLNLWIMGLISLVSSFMGNTASTAFSLPIVLGLARRLKISASKLLMPLAFGAILASSTTLISTSTNIITSGVMQQHGLDRLSMFELTPVGIPILLVGLLYMHFAGYHLIPDRVPEAEVRDGLVNRLYFTELVISPDSPLVGKTLAESKLGSDLGLNVLRIVRGNRRFLVPVASTRLEADDTLLVEGLRDEVLEVRSVPGLTIKPEYRFSSEAIDTEDIQLVEVLLLPGSPLIGRTLKSQRFRDRYGAQVLAVVHHDRIGRHRPGLKDLRFHVGDILLLQGDREQLAGLGTHIGFDVLNEVQDILPDNRKQTLSVIIFLAAILLAAFNILPLVVAILGGALLVFLTRCITPQEAYLSINWQIIILIGSMLGAGLAMEHTGTAAFLAGSIVRVVGTANPLWLLTGFFFLTILLTQPMSNQAAAVVVLPIAIGTALQIGLNPRTFAVMIAVAASTSYLTPLEPACLMVYGPGQYRFTDFLRVGLPLTLLIYLVAVILVPLIWPL